MAELCLFPRSMIHAVLLISLSGSLPVFSENWPCWRGPRGDGTSLETNVPLYWNSTNNVRWKAALPGSGHASIIVYRDRLFTVSAATETNERLLLCLERNSGKLLWKRVVLVAPLE